MDDKQDELLITGTKRLGGGKIRVKIYPEHASDELGWHLAIRTERPHPDEKADTPWWIGLSREEVKAMIIFLSRSLMESHDE